MDENAISGDQGYFARRLQESQLDMGDFQLRARSCVEVLIGVSASVTAKTRLRRSVPDMEVSAEDASWFSTDKKSVKISCDLRVVSLSSYNIYM